MWYTSNEEFKQLISEAIDTLPGEHVRNIKNVAIVYDDDPSSEQRQELQLRHDQSLFGLYQGVPLTKRQGMTNLLPDKITLFKGPIERSVDSIAGLKERIRHTIWHEIGHYYGLNHSQIRERE